MNTAPLHSRLSVIQYAFIALPLSFAGLPLYIHMPDFYTRHFGLSLGALAVILLGLRLFDAVQDPFIGYISDKKAKSRFLIIMMGVSALVVGLAGLCFGPQISIPAALWFTLFMILATTGFSIVSININMIGGFWSNDDTQRARISAWREGFALIGLLIAAILPPLLQSYISEGTAFIFLFATFGLCMIASAFLFRIFFASHKECFTNEKQNTSRSFAFLKILKNRDRLFFFMCFLSYLSASIPAVLVLFFIRDYLGAESYSGLFLTAYFLSGAIFMAGWIACAKVKGLYATWMAAMILSVVTFIGACALQPGDIWGYGIICVLSGIALGADLALPPAIIAGRITKNKTQSEATQYYAMLAFLPKVAMALATGGTFLLLDIFGFVAGVENSDQAMSTLLLTYALLPCLIKILAAMLLWLIIKKEGYNHENIERSITHGITHNS